jgi:hypothetical protein
MGDPAKAVGLSAARYRSVASRLNRSNPYRKAG